MNLAIVIPSARATNLVPCVEAMLACEPELSPASIIVVDDGARTGSEGLLPAVTWVPGVSPFVFARNVNLGLTAAGTADVIVLNDDALLVTVGGFTRLRREAHARGVGVCSAGIQGVVGNPRQRPQPSPSFRWEPERLAFVCVYIPRRVIDQVGVLDEQFEGYGFEDFDYCRRALAAGYTLGIWDGCVVAHRDELIPSTYRHRPDVVRLFEESQARYREKWA